MNQVIENFVSTLNQKNNYLDEDGPWTEMLAATAFAVKSRYYTRLQATPYSCYLQMMGTRHDIEQPIHSGLGSY